jgi:hypothetical protein
MRISSGWSIHELQYYKYRRQVWAPRVSTIELYVDYYILKIVYRTKIDRREVMEFCLLYTYITFTKILIPIDIL